MISCFSWWLKRPFDKTSKFDILVISVEFLTYVGATIIVVSYQDLFAIKALSWDTGFTLKFPAITVIFYRQILRQMRFLSNKSHAAFNNRARSPRSNDTGEEFGRHADVFLAGIFWREISKRQQK